MAPRRNPVTGESSSALPDDSAAAEAMLHFDHPTNQERSDRLRSKDFGEFRFIDWNVLTTFGQATVVREFLSTPGWATLLSISEPTYFELTVEFFSSFDFRWAGGDNVLDFRMGGMTHCLPLRQFNTVMGFCNEAFTRTDAYTSLLIDFPHGFNLQRFWTEISDDTSPYSPKKSKGSHLLSPALRYIHYLLTFTLSARGDSHGVVTRTDLLYLYSLYERVPLNLGSALAMFFRHQAENRRLSALHGGPFVTYLAKRLGVWDTLPRMTLLQEPSPITLHNLRALGLMRRRGQDFEPVPAAVGGDPIDVDLTGDFDDAPPPPPFPQQQHPQFPPAFGQSAYFDQQFGRIHTRLDQIQNEQLSMRAHFDTRFSTLEQRHASSMEHLQREFADLRTYYQQDDDDEDA